MLNNKGIYFANGIIDRINELTDILIKENIIKSSDLSSNSANRADISKTVSTQFSGDNTTVAFIVSGHSREIYRNFYNMGSKNLEGNDLADAYTYFSELKSVYDDTTSYSKSYNYFRKYIVRAMDAKEALKRALTKAEMGNGIANKDFGTSYRFETSIDAIIPSFSIKGEDFTKVGLRLPNVENEYVQIEKNDLFREKTSSNATSTNVILNIIYGDDKEKNSKIYPVISTFEGKAFKIVRMISATDLMDILVNDYHASVSNEIFDNEAFYQKCNEESRKCLKRVHFIATGKNKVSPINVCENNNIWSSAVLKSNTIEDLSNVSCLTYRSLEHAMTRSRQKRTEY